MMVVVLVIAPNSCSGVCEGDLEWVGVYRRILHVSVDEALMPSTASRAGAAVEVFALIARPGELVRYAEFDAELDDLLLRQVLERGFESHLVIGADVDGVRHSADEFGS